MVKGGSPASVKPAHVTRAESPEAARRGSCHGKMAETLGAGRMSKQGTVKGINARRGMVAIKTDDGGYTIIELSGHFEIRLGDRMGWANDYGLGGETYTNLTSGGSARVYVQNHDVPDAQVRQQLLG
jgi:hypothetical protein